MQRSHSHVLWCLGVVSAVVLAEPVYPDIKHVHVINACHLDIGFADSSAGIVNRYFDQHLLAAASIGDELRRGVPGFTDDRLNFMFQSWVLDLYFDCPHGMGLHCPSEANMQLVRGAIQKGDITWHAFPHNAQLEIMDPALIRAGIALTHRFDAAMGQSPKSTLSQRDVPGMTRAAIPLLRSSNVTAISIGANDGSTPPSVPPCFVWKDPQSNASVLGLFNWPGYGSLPISHQKLCIVDGFDHALVYNFNGDNSGPSTAETYGERWQEVAKSFPNARIHASTFDNFVQELRTVEDRLPVVDMEVGDTWIYGVPSDPQKVSRMKAVNRVYADLDKRSDIVSLLERDTVLRNATRFFLKLGEHTWGRDVKNNLHDNYNWKNADFANARISPANGSQYMALETSWWEQRHWGITVGMDTLRAGEHPLAGVLLDEFARLQPKVPSKEGYVNGSAEHVYQCGPVDISFDSSGAISHLAHDDVSWADANHTLLQLKYRSYSAADVNAFFSQYCKSNASWVQLDYGKPGLPSDVKGKFWMPSLSGLSVRQSDNQCSFLMNVNYEHEASEEYGAASGWTRVDIDDGNIDISVGMFKKQTTRIPEAMFVQFFPLQSGGEWSVNKLGSWVRSVDVIDGGSKHLHGNTDAGVRLEVDGHSFAVSAMDAAVVNFGELTAYPSPVHSDPDTASFGASFLLWDNLWGTNYVQWWPFVVPPPSPYEASNAYFPASWNNDMISRFQLRIGGHRAEEIWV
eukprot:TRINITY_DN25336_c0_g1_i1.p1 TRINITY_DN25336_c0_g1~~TRINITY_DN25336_c0_g1_i1.p1  ORF type:complete len:743 (-),score=75.20 TRINITY_DN25336_c0_g1_i1:191-2419(-)